MQTKCVYNDVSPSSHQRRVSFTARALNTIVPTLFLRSNALCVRSELWVTMTTTAWEFCIPRKYYIQGTLPFWLVVMHYSKLKHVRWWHILEWLCKEIVCRIDKHLGSYIWLLSKFALFLFCLLTYLIFVLFTQAALREREFLSYIIFTGSKDHITTLVKWSLLCTL